MVIPDRTGTIGSVSVSAQSVQTEVVHPWFSAGQLQLLLSGELKRSSMASADISPLSVLSATIYAVASASMVPQQHASCQQHPPHLWFQSGHRYRKSLFAHQ